MNVRISLLFMLLFNYGYFAVSQYPTSPFVTKTFTAQDGLPHSYVFSMAQDRRGYMWLVTRYGLCRFDGQAFSPISLINNKAHPLGSIIEDDEGRLMILTVDGLYNLQTNKKTEITGNGNYIPVIFLNKKKKTDFWELRNDSIYKIFNTERKKAITGIYKNAGFTRKIFVTDTGWYYNYMTDFLFIRNTGEIKNISDKVSKPVNFLVVTGYENDTFYFYTNNGLYAYKNGKIKPLFLRSLSQKHIYIAYKDQNNCWWVATQQDGILVSKAGEEEEFEYSIHPTHNLISGFYEDKEENMWIAGFEGLIKVKKKKYDSYTKNNFSWIADINLLAKDKNGTVFIFSETNGFGTWHKGQFSYNKRNALKGQLIDIMTMDDKGRFWGITRQNKLILLENQKATIINDSLINTQQDLDWHITFDNYRKKVWIPGDNLMLGDEKGFTIFKDNLNRPLKYPKSLIGLGNGNIVVATLSNQLLLIKRNNTIEKINIPDNFQPQNIYRFFTDSVSNIWVSYPGLGLLKCKIKDNKQLEIISRFSRETGLTNDFVQSMIFDKKGYLWLSTMAGIAVLDLKNRATSDVSVYLYGKEEGIPATGLEYGRLLCDDDGNIWYSTQNELMKFRMNEMQFKNIPPHVTIENVLINNRETNWKKYTDTLAGVFRIPVDPVLNYYENTVTISYKAATMTNAENIQYSYLLSGIHNLWSNSSKTNTITFTNLKPGPYTFFVRARTNNLDWRTPALFSFTILKPYWQQWWFLLLIIFTCAGIIYWIFRLRIRQLNKEKQIRDQIASDLHDDLGSTLNSVKIFANLALIEKNNSDYLIKVKENTQEAIVGIRDIIWVLDDKKDTMEHLLTRVKQFAEPLCLASHIHLIAEADDSLYKYNLTKDEKRNLFMLIKEAVNNSIKHSNCKNIRLIISSPNKLTVTISDDGIGFDTQNKGDGNGLKNMVSRSSDIGYKINIQSAPGKGTSIQLTKN